MSDWLTILSIVFVFTLLAFALRGAAKEHPFTRGELIRCIVQLVLAILIGAPVWYGLEGVNSARGLGALAVGVTGSWLLMKLYVRLRYGKGAKITMD